MNKRCPRKIARALLEGLITAPKAASLLMDVPTTDRREFMESVVFISGLMMLNIEPEGSQRRYYDRGIEVIAEVLSLPRTTLGWMLSNDLQAVLFTDTRSGPLASDNLTASQKLVIRRAFVDLQAKNITAASRLIGDGRLAGRSDKLLKAIEQDINKEGILHAAILDKRVDQLYDKTAWRECLPFLSGLAKDKLISVDLGL